LIVRTFTTIPAKIYVANMCSGSELAGNQLPAISRD